MEGEIDPALIRVKQKAASLLAGEFEELSGSFDTASAIQVFNRWRGRFGPRVATHITNTRSRIVNAEQRVGVSGRAAGEFVDRVSRFDPKVKDLFSALILSMGYFVVGDAVRRSFGLRRKSRKGPLGFLR